MSRFEYHPELLARYPSLAAALVTVTGADNTSVSPTLADTLVTEAAAVGGRLDQTPIPQLPSIVAWRRVFTSFGTRPTQHRNAAEALLRRVVNGNGVPSLNPLVDIGNIVSIRHAVPVAVFDLDHIVGALTVRHAEGTEQFHGLGADGAGSPEPGEVIFVDDDEAVHARRWCWRQSRSSATHLTTSNALMVIEAHHADARQTVGSAATDAADLVRRHLPEAVITFDLQPERS